MTNIILFYSTNQAIWCNEVLTENSIQNKMVSVPRDLSSDCGYCVTYKDSTKEIVSNILEDEGIEFDRIVN